MHSSTCSPAGCACYLPIMTVHFLNRNFSASHLERATNRCAAVVAQLAPDWHKYPVKYWIHIIRLPGIRKGTLLLRHRHCVEEEKKKEEDRRTIQRAHLRLTRDCQPRLASSHSRVATCTSSDRRCKATHSLHCKAARRDEQGPTRTLPTCAAEQTGAMTRPAGNQPHHCNQCNPRARLAG